jgi:hypothetical protein
MKKQKRQTQKKSDPTTKRPIRGVIRARKCAACNHHEMGIITKKGGYFPLKPGMRVEVIEE